MLRSDSHPQPEAWVVLMPVFDDWQSVGLLLIDLDNALQGRGLFAEIVVVDDASVLPFDNGCISRYDFHAIKKISILELTRNLGHQRAIALGLAYVEANINCEAVVVMDADGEDDPNDVPSLIEKCRETGGDKMVFARRLKRNEGSAFRFFYVAYKGLFKLLTGRSIRVGNFSIVPKRILRRLVHVSEIWNHYAVGVMKAKIPTTEILTVRGKRLAGKPRMTFVSHVVHGLSAISVFGDVIGIRLLIATVFLFVSAIVGISATVGIRLATNLAIPGWATSLSAILLVIALQALMLALFFMFIILSSRNNVNFLPAKEYLPLIFRFQTIFPVEPRLLISRSERSDHHQSKLL